MTTQQHIAKHLRDFYHGKNWTWVWFKQVIEDLTWEEAIRKVHDFNTIALLVYHMNYYTRTQIRVIRGEPLNASDQDSFNAPAIGSEKDWKALLEAVYRDSETLAVMIEQLPDEELNKIFVEEKYGTFYRNLHGNIEHMHYHLGQIVLIKKLIRSGYL